LAGIRLGRSQRRWRGVARGFAAPGDPVKSLESTVLDGYVRNAPSTIFVPLAQATFVVAALFNLVPALLLFGWYSLVVSLPMALTHLPTTDLI
jgi:hypothetical protein